LKNTSIPPEIMLRHVQYYFQVIRDAFRGSKNIETKAGDWDLVTQYDKKVEAILIDNLAKKFPTHK